MPLTRANSTVIESISASQILPSGATAGQVLTYNGTTNTWVASAGSSGGGVRVLNDVIALTTVESGTFTVPANTTLIDVHIVGGGGGGRSAPGMGTFGGGGSGAGYAILIGLAVSPGQTFNYTVGAGGASNGNGGTSTFGNLLTATGGFAGLTMAPQPNTGIGIGGTINRAGGAGAGPATNYFATAGGLYWDPNQYPLYPFIKGKGGRIVTGGGGTAASGFGAGGGGADNSAGGAGSPGAIVIHCYS